MNDSLASSPKSALFGGLSPRLKITSRAVAALILAAAALGCGATSDEPAAQPIAAEEAAERASASTHDGALGMFTAAAGELNLSPQQQQAVDAIKADLRSKAAPVREAKAKLSTALAEGVAKGSLDPQALAAPVSALSLAVEAFKPALQDGINRLHATLDEGQRERLVALIQERAEERRDAFSEGGGIEGRGMRGRMKKIAAELDLSRDQIQSIRSSFRAEREAHTGKASGMMAKRGEVRAHLQKLGEAFKGDSFDARALDAGKELPAMATRRAERASRMLSIVTPVLSPSQREKLATIVKTRGAALEKAVED
jgi:Spy/CpxP family protein refolding chaperone